MTKRKLRLGRRLDAPEGPLTLDPDRLCTHGVVFGMTGSGKTGLCIGLLEELTKAGVPLLLIDPKGDLANLALLFPDLTPTDFEPWVDAREAERRGMSVEELARLTASAWEEGLAASGLEAEDLRRLAEGRRLRIYTPGDDSGIPINVLGALARPPEKTRGDASALRDLVIGTVSSLLGLVGRDADPVRDPEHITLSRIVDGVWQAGEELTLERLIGRLVDPPFEKVGVFPVDTFFPPDDRMELAMALNGILASPAFEGWTRGAVLDLDRLTRAEDGKAPVSIFSLAHLGDQERMFFVSLLLERILAWSRTLSGTSALRTLLYFDEVVGYLPPHPKNPASKGPLLTLLKQARSVGLGCVLATQNPVDVDYKALSNTGTWFVGRLQTAQDRDRIAEGLAGPTWERDAVETALDSLEKRVFLVKEAGSDAPVRFHTRWAMSYLRGPMTRRELARLPEPVRSLKQDEQTETPAETRKETALPSGARPDPPALPGPFDRAYLDPAVVFSARMDGLFEPQAEPPLSEGRLLFRPALWVELFLRFDERRGGFVKDERCHRLYFPLDEGLDRGFPAPLDAADLLEEPPEEAVFAPLPEILDEEEELERAEDEAVEEIYRNVSRGQWVNPELKLYAAGDEDEAAFRRRCEDAVQERIDEEVRKLKERAEKRVDRLEKKIRKAESKIAELEAETSGRRLEEAVGAGEILWGLFTGRRRSLRSAIGRRRRASKAAERLERARAERLALEEEMAALAEELEEEIERIEEEEREALEATEARSVRLEKSDIDVRRFGILYIPVSRRV